MNMSLLVRDVQVIDGISSPAYKADVLIVGGRIAGVGNFGLRHADEVIQGFGYYLAPGFIDVDTDSDHFLSLFTNPSQKDFLLQGTTTILGGLCGSSLAPLLYGDLHSIKWWNNPGLINVNWHSVKEFLSVLGRIPLGVNFGTLVGHYTVRRDIASEPGELSEKELRIFADIVRKSLEQGAFGLSTGLGYVSARETPEDEIKFLLKGVRSYNGIYATHLRSETSDMVKSVKETVEAAKGGVTTIISHFRPLIGFEDKYEKSLEIIERNLSEADVYFDIYPHDTSTIALSAVLPVWMQKDDFRAVLEDLGKPGRVKRVAENWASLNFEEIIIANAPGREYLAGKSLLDFSKNRGLQPIEGLIELMKLTRLEATILLKNINRELALKALAHKRSLIASDSASLPEKGSALGERARNTFPKFLETVAPVLPLESAIEKITSLPAKILNLKNRGVIKEGNVADLVIFKDCKIRDVIVSGRIAVRDGEYQDIRAGKILRHYAEKTR